MSANPRAHWQSRLDAIWYAGAPLPWALDLLARVYARLLSWRRWLYANRLLRSRRMPVPVVVVGNLTVGGTGKTPLVAAVVGELRQRGWRPGIALRGYGGRRRRPALLPPDPQASEFGDEAVLLARATGAPVATGRDRAEAAALLVSRDCNLVVCDDGLQHWGLARDIEVLVIDGVRRFGNQRLLPAGPLREPIERASRVDFTVANGGTAEAGEHPMQVLGTRAVGIGPGARAIALESLQGQSVHAVAGIGNPERFFRMLESFGIGVRRHPMPDHHVFDGTELRFDDDLPVLITEKDAVKCAAFAGAGVYVVPVEAQLEQSFYDRLNIALHRVRESDG
jgi:tetraacyldisaccharide 4'-kinase